MKEGSPVFQGRVIGTVIPIASLCDAEGLDSFIPGVETPGYHQPSLQDEKAERLRRLLRFLFQQLGDDLLDDLISKCADFVWGLWLDRMGNKDWFVL